MISNTKRIYINTNKNKKEEKHPDLRLAAMIDDENGETRFKEVGAAWKAKSGSGGYVIKLSDNAVLSVEEQESEQQEAATQEDSDEIASADPFQDDNESW